jgi:broad specificity phosphatase PhoE
LTTRILLVRHASHDRLGRVLCGRMPGVGLSEVGRTEAEHLATRLAGREGAADPVSAVYTSPMQRARETAEPIASACRLPLAEDGDLTEIDFGTWTGQSFDQLAPDPLWTRWNTDRGRAFAPGGETMNAAQGRMGRWFDRMVERHPDGTVLGVGHADVIKAGLCLVLGLPLHFHDRFDVDPASVSVIVAGRWGMKVQSINGTVP